MIKEPKQKRAIAFVGGQDLFHAAKESFGYSFPNYDVKLLVEKICQDHGWLVERICFYTGVPDAQDNIRWNTFWNKKLANMGKKGIKVFQRVMRYRNETVSLPNGQSKTILVGQEKGIDVRIALDIIALALDGAYDVALVFSQDQDLSEVADEIRKIAGQQNRWIKIASAFPKSPTSKNTRGINKTDWIPIDRTTYDSCIDPKDYR